MNNFKKYDIVLIDLEPTKGSEQQGLRPCLIVQNNLANLHANTIVACPISSVLKDYPHTLIISPSSENNLSVESRIDILQIRTLDKSRILKKIGTLDHKHRALFKQKFCDSFDIDDEFENYFFE